MILFAARGGRQEGQSITMMVAIQQAVTEGKVVIVATNDYSGTLRRLQYYLPRAWFVIENDYIRIVV